MSLDAQFEPRISPEKPGESLELSEKGKLETGGGGVSEQQPVSGRSPAVVDTQGVGKPGIDSTRVPLHQEIESILEEDLEEIFFSMDERTQQVFKQKGEQAAQEIMKLIQQAKVTFKKVFKLIFAWLKIIPGVNKFFLEKESKIKTDKILNLADKR